MSTDTATREAASAAWRDARNSEAAAETAALLDLEHAIYALEDYEHRPAIARLLASAKTVTEARAKRQAAGHTLFTAYDEDPT